MSQYSQGYDCNILRKPSASHLHLILHSPIHQNNRIHLSLIIMSIKDCIYPFSFPPCLSRLSMTNLLCLLSYFSLISPSKYFYCGVCYVDLLCFLPLLCIVPNCNKTISWQSPCCLVHRLIFRKIYTAFFFNHFRSHLNGYPLLLLKFLGYIC